MLKQYSQTLIVHTHWGSRSKVLGDKMDSYPLNQLLFAISAEKICHTKTIRQTCMCTLSDIIKKEYLITLARVGTGHRVQYLVCLPVCYHKIAVNFNYLKQATSHKLGNL